MRRVSKRKRRSNQRVSNKISVLVREGTPQRQAIAEAMSMERAGRLRRGGVYVRAGKRRSKRRAHRSRRR